jgi:hypothetical protein
MVQTFFEPSRHRLKCQTDVANLAMVLRRRAILHGSLREFSPTSCSHEGTYRRWRLYRASCGRSWRAHFEFTRINITSGPNRSIELPQPKCLISNNFLGAIRGRQLVQRSPEPEHGHGLKLVISRVSEEMSAWLKELGLIRIGARID